MPPDLPIYISGVISSTDRWKRFDLEAHLERPTCPSSFLRVVSSSNHRQPAWNFGSEPQGRRQGGEFVEPPSASLEISLRSDAIGLCYARRRHAWYSSLDASALRDPPRLAVM